MTLTATSLCDVLGAKVHGKLSGNGFLLEFPDGRCQEVSGRELAEMLKRAHRERRYVPPRRMEPAVITDWENWGIGVWRRRIGSVEELRYADGRVVRHHRPEWEPSPRLTDLGRCAYCKRQRAGRGPCEGCGAPL